MDGAKGGAGSTPALGGAGNGGENGGAGGAAGATKGVVGPHTIYDYSGGGGGACGRIRINTSSGKATITGTLSPSLGDGADAGTPLATIGTLDVRK